VTNLGIGYFIWHDIILFGKIFINALFFIDFYMAINNLSGRKQPRALFLRAARGRGRIAEGLALLDEATRGGGRPERT